MSLEDVIGYLKWLSSKSGKTYRLPSEAEWEYLARGGSQKRWPWGDLPDGSKENCRDCKGQWAGRRAAPVGSFKANKFGLSDVIGNVWELTRDCKNESYAGAPSDGRPWLKGDCSFVMLRGASWDTDQKNTYVGVRNWMQTNARHDVVGFRVVRELGEGRTNQPTKVQSKPEEGKTADVEFARELVNCAALRSAEAETTNLSDNKIALENDRDQLVNAVKYFLGNAAAGKTIRKRSEKFQQKISATSGQSSKLKMLADTCQILIDTPKFRYAYWQENSKN